MAGSKTFAGLCVWPLVSVSVCMNACMHQGQPTPISWILTRSIRHIEDLREIHPVPVPVESRKKCGASSVSLTCFRREKMTPPRHVRVASTVEGEYRVFRFEAPYQPIPRDYGKKHVIARMDGPTAGQVLLVEDGVD
ncbi:predicted protein [Histoplasma capsulatum var. duboisii H88]|uniref:Predicted protein n=1 Tax=Ajellomyces capsulatus (strain H88) TaxID=544711 RepID=F0UKH3_AJEC8|nr:predicted protein [Histoplasma capsulatum var. duboisii H88]